MHNTYLEALGDAVAEVAEEDVLDAEPRAQFLVRYSAALKKLGRLGDALLAQEQADRLRSDASRIRAEAATLIESCSFDY